MTRLPRNSFCRHMHSCLVRAQLGRNPEAGDAPATARCSLGCGRAPRPEPDCLVGEGEPHEISGAFSSPRGAGHLKSFLPQCLGPGAGEGRPGHPAPGPAQAVAFCSPAPVDRALEKEVAYHRLFILERISRAGEESESLPASSH